jgi:hypothetical protein
LPSRETIAEHYFLAIYDRVRGIGSRAAAPSDLLDTPEAGSSATSSRPRAAATPGTTMRHASTTSWHLELRRSSRADDHPVEPAVGGLRQQIFSGADAINVPRSLGERKPISVPSRENAT